MRSSTSAPFSALLAALACACQPASDDSTTATGSTSAATTSTATTTDTTTDATTAVTTSSTGPDTPTTTTADPSSTTDDPTTTTATTGGSSTTTGGGMVIFPTDCPNPIAGPFADAIVDTFFVNEPPTGNGCTLNGAPNLPCRDHEFGKAEAYELFLYEDPQPTKSVVSVFAARFAAPQPTYADLPPELAALEGTEVMTASWVGARLKFHVFRPAQPAEWTSTVLRLLRFAEGDTWQSGPGLAFTPCDAPASSFRCRECDTGIKACTNAWSAGDLPYAYPFAPVAEFPLADAPGADGTVIVIDLPVEAVGPGAPWLLEEGVMVVPAPTLPIKALAVHTLEAAQPEQRPQLGVLYCNPELAP